MASIPDISKKRGRGRPSTGGQMPGLMVRMPPDQLAALDAFIARESEPKPTRPEVVRRALTDFLTGLGLMKHREDPEGANGS